MNCLDCGHCESCIDRSIAEWERHNREQAEMGAQRDEKVSEAIIAAANELIESDYCTTSGLITRDALHYRLVGIIGKHLGNVLPGVVS